MSIKIYAVGSAEAEAALAAPGEKHVSINREEMVIYTGEDLPPFVTSTPTSVTPWQIRKALNALRLRDAVEAAVAAGSQDMKDGWEFATEVRRDDPLVVAMGAALGKSSKDLDELFALAATL